MSPHTTRRSFTELLLLPIPIILIPIRGTTPGWGWRGVGRDLRSVLGPAVTGAIAIGAMATSISTTTIISTETPTETSTVVKLARATGGSITRSTGEMLPTGTGKRQISTAPMPVSSLGAELALAQVVVELAPGRVEVARRLGPVAVAPRTKLVTGAHHHGLVPLLAAEDLAAAAAETTREPAA